MEILESVALHIGLEKVLVMSFFEATFCHAEEDHESKNSVFRVALDHLEGQEVKDLLIVVVSNDVMLHLDAVVVINAHSEVLVDVMSDVDVILK